MLICLLTFGCAQNQGVGQQGIPAETTSKKVYKGKVTGKSNRTKTIAIEVIVDGSAKTIEVNFDDRTRGIDHAVKGKQVAVTFTMIHGKPYATSVKPELTKFAAGVSEITVKNVKKLIDNKKEFLLVDSRPERQYAGSHLPTAISIPACTMKEQIDMLPEGKNELLVFYCGGPTCGMSSRASAVAAQAGYKNIKVMLAGESGWAMAGYPTYADDDFVTRGDIVLIDLRAARNDTVERIPRSISIPFATLDERIDDISIKAPIVVYSDNIQESLAALTEFRTAGFSRVSMVAGNFKGWKKRNNPVTSGPIVTKISWKRKPGKGEVSPVAFQKAMNGKIDAVILDVRTSTEVAAGKLKRAKHIPLNELSDRSGELPANKKIYIYSATGARADMACNQLKESGYEAYFLVADVNCQGGTCEIEY